MEFDQRQAMQDMIEAAAKDQEKQLSWIKNLYQKRLKELQETQIKYQEWLKSKENSGESKDDLA